MLISVAISVSFQQTFKSMIKGSIFRFKTASFLCGFTVFSFFYSISASAQIIPDTTLPNTSIVSSNCIDCEITGGTKVGRNLFHSFEQFSIVNGGRAFFNNAGEVQNIFARVTGRSISNIDGILQANGTANLFLLNPNGILFGRDASLNLGGSFFAMTGDRINFADGSQFNAANPQATPLLTVSAPIGLQFGQNAGVITNRSQSSINGELNTLHNPVGLRVSTGESLVLLGNGILMENGNLTARGGQVQLGSLAPFSQVRFTRSGDRYVISYPNNQNFANIRLNNGSTIDTSGELGIIANGGAIQLRGRNLLLTNSASITSSTYQGIGGNLQFLATKSVTLNSSFAGTFTEGVGQAGDVIIRANDTVNLIGNPGALGSQALKDSIGDAGELRINTQRLSVQDGFRIEASTFGRGNGGDILITSNTVEVIGFNRQPLDVDGNLDTRGTLPSAIASQVGISSQENVGNGGNIVISARRLILRDGGFISSATFAGGNSGTLTINATDSISIHGTTPAVTRNQYRSGIFVSAEPGASGAVCRLQVTTDRLTVDDRAEISANNRGTGEPGTARLNVDRLIIHNGGEIRAGSPRLPDGLAPNPNQGAGGRLTINANSIRIDGTGTIGSETFPSAIAAYSESAGNAGSLEIRTSTLDVYDGADVSVSGRRTGAAGNLFITADRITLDRGRLAAATRFGQGDNSTAEITLNSLNLLTIQNGSLLSARAENQARGGNITVTAPSGFVIAAEANNDIVANAVQGRGGNITIAAQSILGLTEQRSTPVNLTNDIDASSQFGSPGSVTLDQLAPDPSEGAVQLPSDIIDATSLVSRSCSTRWMTARSPSQFIITGRGGLAANPIEPLQAESLFSHWISLQPSSTSSTHGNWERVERSTLVSPVQSSEILEAQGFIVTESENIALVASDSTVTHTPRHNVNCQ
jgi:filamentous hemagglutinin family protein